MVTILVEVVMITVAMVWAIEVWWSHPVSCFPVNDTKFTKKIHFFFFID